MCINRKIGIDISVLIEQKRTGIAVYNFELVKVLLKINKKDRFTLFALVPLKASRYVKNLGLGKFSNADMKIFKIPARLFRKIFLLWQKLDWPPIEMLSGKVDIFHTFNWYLPPQSKGKIVATIYDLTALAFPQWHDERTVQLEKIRLKRIIERADVIVTISENSKKDILKHWPNSRVEIVYPAARKIFNNKINPLRTKKVLKKYKISPGFFLSVSTLEPRKNLETLIKAFVRSNIDSKLVLVGVNGWKNEEIMKQIRNHSQKIKAIGFVSDEELLILYQQAYCLIYPSFYEGFGMPVLEAMSCGTAVICSNTSSLPEVGGDAVMYVNPNKISSLQDALLKIKKNKKLRDGLVKAGLQQAQKFSWEESGKRMNEIYQNLVV